MIKDVEQELTEKCITNDDYFTKMRESSGKLILMEKLLTKY